MTVTTPTFVLKVYAQTVVDLDRQLLQAERDQAVAATDRFLSEDYQAACRAKVGVYRSLVYTVATVLQDALYDPGLRTIDGIVVRAYEIVGTQR